jgi:16S rRNA (cytidine1402-2'-O)-methyltransferase
LVGAARPSLAGLSIRQWYNKARHFMPGTLFVVATPIGNLEDISARALRVLREVALIAAEDTRRTGHLLARYAITTRTISLHEHNERARSGSLVERLKAGESIALVSDAGTPTVSDPGTYLIKEAIEANVKVEPIPGPNAALATLSVSGMSNTSFTFLGFPPTRSKDRIKWFEELKAAGRTVVFYEAPHRIGRTLEQLLATVGDVRVVVGRELTKIHEELVRGPISAVLPGILESHGEYTVVVDIGHMASISPPDRPDTALLLTEFGELTQNSGLTRRRAISVLSRRYGLSSNHIYAALEEAKRLAE